MRAVGIVLALSLAGSVTAAHSATVEAGLNRYFKLWETNGTVTRANVHEVYARAVSYYGLPMDREQVFQAKQYFVRLWPKRQYSVVPGTVRKVCTGQGCKVDLVLAWKVADAGSRRGTTGATTVAIDLVYESGALKIARENGTAVARSLCSNAGSGWDCRSQRQSLR